MDSEKNNATSEPTEPDNDVVQRYRLLPNRYRLYLSKPRTCQGDTRAIDRHQTRRCNTIWLLEPDPQLAEWPLEYESRQPPNPKYNGFCDLQL